MRPLNVTCAEGLMKYLLRIDSDPRGRGFWVVLRLRAGGPETDAFVLLQDWSPILHKRGLTMEGGETEDRVWKLLITSDRPRASSTEEDRATMSVWLRDRPEISDLDVGPIESTRGAEAQLLAGWDAGQQRWLGAAAEAPLRTPETRSRWRRVLSLGRG